MVVVLAVAIALGIWALMSTLDARNPQLATSEPVVQLAPIPKLGPNTDPNAVDVLVAAEDLPAGTVITPNNIAKLVAWKRIAKDTLPGTATTDENQLHNMRFWRPLRNGEIIGVFDIHSQSLHAPEGKELATIPIATIGGGGVFYATGCRVDIIATVRCEKRLESFIVVRDAVILAILDSRALRPSWFSHVGLVLTVDPKEKELIEFALTRQCNLEAVLLHPESPPNTEPVDFNGAKKLLEEAPPKTPTEP